MPQQRACSFVRTCARHDAGGSSEGEYAPWESKPPGRSWTMFKRGVARGPHLGWLRVREPNAA